MAKAISGPPGAVFVTFIPSNTDVSIPGNRHGSRPSQGIENLEAGILMGIPRTSRTRTKDRSLPQIIEL